MGQTLIETQVLNELSELLYGFLPGSGNNSYSFPIAAQKAGVGEHWTPGISKTPAIVHLLQATLSQSRHRFCPLILAIVQLGILWRAGKSRSGMTGPLTIQEINRVNALLLKLQFKIPDLHDQAFLAGLADRSEAPAQPVAGPSDTRVNELAQAMLALNSLNPQPRGIAFEQFLSAAFLTFGLAPRGAFSLRGEQIDGSFQLEGATYLLGRVDS